MPINLPNQDVISFFSYLSPADRIWTYWNNIRKDGPVPNRGDIQPADLGSTLEGAFLVKYCPNYGAMFQVAGLSVETNLGRKLTDTPLFTMIAPSLQTSFIKHVKRVFNHPATLSMTLSISKTPNSPVTTAEFTLLPLLDKDGNVTRAIGGLNITGVVSKHIQYFDGFSRISLDILKKKPKQKGSVSKKTAPKERSHLTLVI